MRSLAVRVLAGGLAAAVLVGCNAQRPLPTVIEHGDRAYRAGDYAKAEADYKEYVTRRPGNAMVESQLARTYLELDRPQDALFHAQQAYDLRPGDEEIIETYAAALLAAGRTDQVHRFLRNLAQDRGRVGDYIRLGRYTAKMGDADGAEHALTTAAVMDQGQTAAPQLALADFYRSIGDNAHEKERLRMALYLDPRNEGVMRRLREMGEIPGPSLALRPAEAP